MTRDDPRPADAVPAEAPGAVPTDAPGPVRQFHRVVRAVGAGARGARGWAARSAGTPRGRVLLALVTVVALAVPSGLGFLLVSVFGGAGGGDGAERVATIGVMAPLSGASADAGAGVRDAVTLAVEEANRQGAIPGWKLEVVAHDDLSRPDGGAAGADLFADDPRMIGVVGPLSSSVALVSLDRLSEAGFPVISPSNAEPTLTERPEQPGERPYPNYFRLSGTDEQLAEAAAGYAVRTLGRTRISVIDGGPDYGTITLAERFAHVAREAGAEVLTVHRVDGGSTGEEEIRRAVDAIRDESPDLVYLATGTAFAGELRQALAEDGISVQVLGSDRLLDHDYIERAGSLAEGDLATDLSVPLSEVPTAGAFVEAYTKRFGEPDGADELLPDGDSENSDHSENSDDATRALGTERPDPDALATERAAATLPASGDSESAGENGPAAENGPAGESEQVRAAALARLRADAIPPVAASAYDAARALIRAAAAVLPGRTAVTNDLRAGIVREVGAEEFAGVTGEVAFDELGDLRTSRVAFYSVTGGRFVPLRIEIES